MLQCGWTARRCAVSPTVVRPPRGGAVGQRGELPAELTAYFCVSRTRMILQNLFTEPETEGRKHDESGGSLLLWQES